MVRVSSQSSTQPQRNFFENRIFSPTSATMNSGRLGTELTVLKRRSTKSRPDAPEKTRGPHICSPRSIWKPTLTLHAEFLCCAEPSSELKQRESVVFSTTHDSTRSACGKMGSRSGPAPRCAKCINQATASASLLSVTPGTTNPHVLDGMCAAEKVHSVKVAKCCSSLGAAAVSLETCPCSSANTECSRKSAMRSVGSVTNRA